MNDYISQIGKALKNVHDFGFVREFSAIQTMSMTSQLTAGYAPIEQYEKRAHFRPYTDMYALGITLYVLLTNQAVLPANYRQENPEIKIIVIHNKIETV